MSEELTPDEIRQALRDYAADNPGLESVRTFRDSSDDPDAAGMDAEAWEALAGQLGMAALTLPEAHGGLELGTPAAVTAAEEAAATLTPGPIRASLLIGLALQEFAPDELPEPIEAALGGLAEGTLWGGATELDADISRVGQLPELRGHGATGTLHRVTHGTVASLVLTTVITDDGPAAVLVVPADPTTDSQAGVAATLATDGTDDGARRTRVSTADFVTPVADIEVSDASIMVLTSPDAPDEFERLAALQRTLLAAELTGGAQGSLNGMVEYARVREQYGQIIGSYQAIAHHCSETAIDVAGARSLVTAAARPADTPGKASTGTAPSALSLLARATAGDTAKQASTRYIQVSGGIGFTWEHDAHLFYRHARTNAALGGTPDRYRDRAAAADCIELLNVEVA